LSTRTDRTLHEFLAEAQEIVDTLSRNLLALERRARGADEDGAAGSPVPALIDDSFRAVHSLKGLSGMVGLAGVARLAHALETLLDALRLDRVALEPGVLDLLFEAAELFGAGLSAAAEGGDLGGARLDEHLRRLDAVVEAAAVPVADAGAGLSAYELDPGQLSVLTAYEEHRLRECIRSGWRLFWLEAQLRLATVDTDLDELKALLAPLGELIACVPGDGDDPDTLAMRFLFASMRPESELRSAVAGRPVTVESVKRTEPAPPEPPAPVHRAGAEEEVDSDGEEGDDEAVEDEDAATPVTGVTGVDDELSLRSVSRTVRVDIRKLDALMNAVGELGLVQAGLEALETRLADRGATAEARDLTVQVRAFRRRLAELQEGILEVRMVPLGHVFDKLSRVVRRLSRSVDKRVSLEIGGAETELDKIIVEELSDPLMHIIRNAIDHGLESPAERVAAGKPEVGTIRIQALQQGNRVVLTIEDDGRGIDEAAVADAALRRGLVSPRLVADMGRRELYNLLFAPGMSTRHEATELSGRGVGLDVVKTNIARLSGIIDLGSTLGHGTTVTITLPVTLAILGAIITRVAGRTYAVPLSGVIETLKIEASEIRTVEGREVITVRGQTLRLARVDHLLRLGRDGAAPQQLFVVVVGVAQHRLGLAVDEVIGEQDIVIKPLGRLLAEVPGVAGATELGGRQTVLVLDVPALVEEGLEARSRPEVAA
jgi:two-component system, chemotaxis family, sensor kinase CheA